MKPIIEKTHEEIKEYKYPAVSTILQNVRKWGLEIYFKQNTPEFIELAGDKAKEIGTSFHDTVYNFVEKTGLETITNYETEVNNCINSFQLFRKENPDITLLKSEIKIESDEFKYSGTMDCQAKEKELPIIFDWKTGEAKKEKKPPIYDEAILQVCSYWKAYEEQEKTIIEKAYVLAVAKDKIAYRLKEITKEARDIKWFPIFKCYLGIHYYKKIKIAKEVK